MPKVIDHKNVTLDSEFSIEKHEGVLGLILESWGPSKRNPEYSIALETILTRLVDLGVPYIRVNVISRVLIKHFPDLDDRAIIIDGKKEIDLHRVSATDLRQEIGRKQAQLKVTPTGSGGNRTKRVLLHNPLIDQKLWSSIAEGNIFSETFRISFIEPTIDRAILEHRVDALISSKVAKPVGNINPRKIAQVSDAFERDPAVKAWVLKLAAGVCELCLRDAPFTKENGMPYLEVHHVRPLSEMGEDTIENTVALCPNCHMRMHFGKDRLSLRRKLIRTVERLVIT